MQGFYTRGRHPRGRVRFFREQRHSHCRCAGRPPPPADGSAPPAACASFQIKRPAACGTGLMDLRPQEKGNRSEGAKVLSRRERPPRPRRRRSALPQGRLPRGGTEKVRARQRQDTPSARAPFRIAGLYLPRRFRARPQKKQAEACSRIVPLSIINVRPPLPISHRARPVSPSLPHRPRQLFRRPRDRRQRRSSPARTS